MNTNRLTALQAIEARLSQLRQDGHDEMEGFFESFGVLRLDGLSDYQLVRAFNHLADLHVYYLREKLKKALDLVNRPAVQPKVEEDVDVALAREALPPEPLSHLDRLVRIYVGKDPAMAGGRLQAATALRGSLEEAQEYLDRHVVPGHCYRIEGRKL